MNDPPDPPDLLAMHFEEIFAEILWETSAPFWVCASEIESSAQGCIKCDDPYYGFRTSFSIVASAAEVQAGKHGKRRPIMDLHTQHLLWQ